MSTILRCRKEYILITIITITISQLLQLKLFEKKKIDLDNYLLQRTKKSNY